MRRKALGGWIAFVALLIGLQVGSTAPAPAQEQSAGSAAADADAPAANEGAEGEAEPAAPAEPEIPPLVRSATRLVTRLNAVQGEWEDLAERLKTAAPSDRLVIDRRIVELKLEYVEVMDELVENLRQQEEEGLEPGPARAFAEERAPDLTVAIIGHIVDSEKRVERIRRERDDATVAAQLELEQRLAREARWLDALYGAYLDNVKHLGLLGLDVT
jgi:hypothetical protein